MMFSGHIDKSVFLGPNCQKEKTADYVAVNANGVLGFSFACGRRPYAKLNRRTKRLKQKVGVGGSSRLGFVARKTNCSAVLTFRVRAGGGGFGVGEGFWDESGGA